MQADVVCTNDSAERVCARDIVSQRAISKNNNDNNKNNSLAELLHAEKESLNSSDHIITCHYQLGE